MFTRSNEFLNKNYVLGVGQDMPEQHYYAVTNINNILDYIHQLTSIFLGVT